MFCIDISDKQLKALASHSMAYQMGLAYFKAGRVSKLVYNPDESKISATVNGNYSYNVQISLSSEGSLHSSYCSCPAFSRYSGACKHVIAVLKAAQLKHPGVSQKTEAQNRATQELLAFFENNNNQGSFQEELNLELELKIQVGYGISAELSLKLGLQRLYVVKDIGELLDCYHKGSDLEFGKQFTFEPIRHTFKEEDRPVVKLLSEMYEEYFAWRKLEAPFSNSSFFKDKSLSLNGVYLRKFLDALGEKSFLLGLGSQSSRYTQVARQALPLEFSLHSQGQDLAFVLETDELPIQLTADGSYFIYQKEIYWVSPAQREILPSMVKAFRKGYTQTVVLPSVKKEFFVSEALPTIQRLGKVAIDPDLADKFSREDLLTKIYFERGSGNGIAARVEFHYGTNVINPFASLGETSNTAISQDVILIRDVEKERKILSILEQAEFSVTQGSIHLEGEQKLFEFAITYLPQLQDQAELYYSEEFKLTIRTSISFSGRVRLDDNLDLLEISFQYSDINENELADIFNALHLKKRYYRLRDGSFLDLNQSELESFAQLLDNLNLKGDDLNQKVINLPKYRALYIDNFLRQANLPSIHRNRAFKQLVQSILEPQDGEFEIPTVLQKVLRDYQKTGFKWLKTLAAYGLGGILADDMGLGKTVQVLSFILSEKSVTTEPALVIAPTSLVYNWQEEANKFAPELKVLVVEGTPQARQALLAGIAQWDLVVTSYPVLRRDIELYPNLDFSYCFLDEAQHIKNPQTINAKSVQQIKAKGYFALTGTPIENSLSELWSIFNFVMPGYLLSHQDFRKKYEIPIVKGDNPAVLKELSRHVTPFILRRLKKDVLLELPDKIETRLKVQMTEEQTKIYLAFLQEARKNIAQEIAAVGFEKSHIKILAALTRLRQICCHPAMFIEDYAGESGKMLLFQEVLTDALDSGHRILVFSQFTSMLDLIQNYLITENIEHFYLKGSTKASERSQMAQSFNAGAGKVFLISLKAGGTGLNLTGADMVIHYDPWWNPAVEEQATDRAHRIGQKNAVQVIKLVTKGTIEEKVYELQEKKKELIQSVIQPGETWLSKFNEDELRSLFEIE